MNLIKYSMKHSYCPWIQYFQPKIYHLHVYKIRLLKHFMLNKLIWEDSHNIFGNIMLKCHSSNFVNCYDVTQGWNYFKLI
jgi:hypothetical protein